MSMMQVLHEYSVGIFPSKNTAGVTDNVVAKHFIDKPRGPSHVDADKVWDSSGIEVYTPMKHLNRSNAADERREIELIKTRGIHSIIYMELKIVRSLKVLKQGASKAILGTANIIKKISRVMSRVSQKNGHGNFIGLSENRMTSSPCTD